MPSSPHDSTFRIIYQHQPGYGAGPVANLWVYVQWSATILIILRLAHIVMIDRITLRYLIHFRPWISEYLKPKTKNSFEFILVCPIRCSSILAIKPSQWITRWESTTSPATRYTATFKLSISVSSFQWSVSYIINDLLLEANPLLQALVFRTCQWAQIPVVCSYCEYFSTIFHRY